MAGEKHHHHPFHHKEQDSGPVDHEKEEKQHKHKEHLGEMGTGAATGFTLYEKHRAKKDPENGHKHKVEKDIAAAVAVGGAAYTFHEKHEKKDAKKEEKHEKKEAKKEEKHSEGHHRFL